MQFILTRRWRTLSRYRPRHWLSRKWVRYFALVGKANVVIWAKRWHGISALYHHRDGERLPLWESVRDLQELTAVKKRKMDPTSMDVKHLAPMESVLLSKVFALVAHCAATRYDDGDPRKPGWWTVKTMGSAWVVEVKDPDTCSRLVVVQQTVDDALTLACVLLESDEAPWEPDPWLKQQESKKRK